MLFSKYSKSNNSTEDMTTANNTSCASPFKGRLTPETKMVNTVYLICTYLIILSIAAYWYKKRGHFIIRDKNLHVCGLQWILSALFVSYNLIFILDEPSPLTSCSASVLLKMTFPASVGPIFLSGISRYNKKLLEYFRAQNNTHSTLGHYGSTNYIPSEYSATKAMKKLKLIHSPKVFKSLLLCFFLLIGLLSVMLEKIICQGWITGEKCAFEHIGIPILSAAFMLLPLLGEIEILCKKFKENKSVDKPWMKNFDYLALALGTTPCVISGLIEIIYHQSFYNETEEVELFPYFLTNIAFLTHYFVLFGHYTVRMYQSDNINNSSVKDDLNLNDILENEISRNFFQAFLVESLCVENLIFILHLRKFKSASEFETENLAKKIYNYFIKEGSIAQVNISGKTRNKIKEKFNNQNISLEVFKEAEDEIIYLLTYDSLSKFKSSPYYPQVVNRFLT
eukprot:snap_masked-scaffold_27-processed-gene-3.10-mRNA-1 protein AED:1.00 eAED:1.00 QI:0/0/0/0/1/1/2/0/451